MFSNLSRHTKLINKTRGVNPILKPLLFNLGQPVTEAEILLGKVGVKFSRFELLFLARFYGRDVMALFYLIIMNKP